MAPSAALNHEQRRRGAPASRSNCGGRRRAGGSVAHLANACLASAPPMQRRRRRTSGSCSSCYSSSTRRWRLYEQALKEASLTGQLRDFAQTALGHERQHLAAIKQALGVERRPKPRFEFGSKTKSADAFRKTAIKLEDIAVAGYNGQATNLTKPTSAVAAEIVSVEARHAAWVRAIAGEVAAPDPVDKPMTASAGRLRSARDRTEDELMDEQETQSFDVSCMRLTSTGRSPRRAISGNSRSPDRGLLAGAAAGAGALLLGGSEARAASALSANDVGILNYALVLEYLQASFYTEARAKRRPLRQDGAGGAGGRRDRASPRQGVPEAARRRSGQAAAVRLPGSDRGSSRRS